MEKIKVSLRQSNQQHPNVQPADAADADGDSGDGRAASAGSLVLRQRGFPQVRQHLRRRER